jgi:hypothetical protein
MMRPHLTAFALALTCTAAPPAVAQTNDAKPAEAVLHAVRHVCGPNVAGRLSFDIMNAGLNGPRVVLADASGDPATLAAFHDMETARVAFGFVVSDTGRINIGVDETLAWCRVAALDVTPLDVAAIKSGLRTLDDWSETGQVAPGVVQYLATLDGDIVFVRVADPAVASGYGPTAGLIVTVMNPAAQEE